MVARWETRQLPDLDQKSDHRRSSSLVGKDFAASIAWRGDSDEAWDASRRVQAEARSSRLKRELHGKLHDSRT